MIPRDRTVRNKIFHTNIEMHIGDDFKDEDNAGTDPLEEDYEDDIFNWPFSYNMEVTNGENVKRVLAYNQNNEQLEYDELDRPYKSFIQLTGTEAGKDNVGVTIKTPGNHIHQSISNEELHDILAPITNKAGEYISNNPNNKEDIRDLVLRDIGFYEGNRTLNLFNIKFDYRLKKYPDYKDIAKATIDTMIDKFQNFHSEQKDWDEGDADRSPAIKSVLDNTMNSMHPVFKGAGLLDKSEYPDANGYLYTPAHDLMVHSFMGIMLHGAGSNQFTDLFLQGLEKSVPEPIKKLVGDDWYRYPSLREHLQKGQMTKNNLTFLMGVLTPKSSYHQRAVKNYYRLNCS